MVDLFGVEQEFYRATTTVESLLDLNQCNRSIVNEGVVGASSVSELCICATQTLLLLPSSAQA